MVAILAVVAGGLVLAFSGTEQHVTEQVAATEIQELKKAILQFKQDTGFYPGQGPFALSTDSLAGLVAVPPGGSAWFHSPANFVQLFDEPLDASDQPIMPFNPNTGRGWRGPYLEWFGNGFVDVGDSLDSTGAGSPSTGASLPNLLGVADPFKHPPESNGLLAWRSAPGEANRSSFGRPYLLMLLDDPTTTNVVEPPRLVSLGPNGQYEAGLGDDIVLELPR